MCHFPLNAHHWHCPVLSVSPPAPHPLISLVCIKACVGPSLFFGLCSVLLCFPTSVLCLLCSAYSLCSCLCSQCLFWFVRCYMFVFGTALVLRLPALSVFIAFCRQLFVDCLLHLHFCIWDFLVLDISFITDARFWFCYLAQCIFFHFGPAPKVPLKRTAHLNHTRWRVISSKP